MAGPTRRGDDEPETILVGIPMALMLFLMVVALLLLM